MSVVFFFSFPISSSLLLQVIPQLIARIDTPRALVGRLIHQLLTDIGRYHPQVSPFRTLDAMRRQVCVFSPPVVPLTTAVEPLPLQALIYPLTVASKSTTTARHNAANKILKNMCEHCNTLVQQAIMVQTFHSHLFPFDQWSLIQEPSLQQLLLAFAPPPGVQL